MGAHKHVRFASCAIPARTSWPSPVLLMAPLALAARELLCRLHGDDEQLVVLLAHAHRPYSQVKLRPCILQATQPRPPRVSTWRRALHKPCESIPSHAAMHAARSRLCHISVTQSILKHVCEAAPMRFWGHTATPIASKKQALHKRWAGPSCGRHKQHMHFADHKAYRCKEKAIRSYKHFTAVPAQRHRKHRR